MPEYICDKFYHTENEIQATVRFDKSVRWRLGDEYGGDGLVVHENGDVERTFTWSDVPSFFEYILTFGDKAEIISPIEYREQLKELVKKIYDKY